MANAMVWCDIPVFDLDRAVRFYSAVMGAELPTQEYDWGSLAFLPTGGEGVSGCLFECDDIKPTDQGILVYLNAEGRLDEAIAAVVPNGGKNLIEKQSIAPHGWRAVVLDTEGNRVALHTH